MAQDISEDSILIISSAHPGYRRAGLALDSGTNVIAAHHLTDAQLAMLEADPRLVVAAGETENPAAKTDPGGSAAQPLGDSPLPDPLAVLLGDAIAQLDPQNPDHFTSGGKPQVDALSDITYQPVSAAQRDAAWMAYQTQQAQE